MGYNYRALREEKIILNELVRQNRKNSRATETPIRKTDIKMAFFKDKFSKSFPHDNTICDKIEARKAALVKNGYWTTDGEITELGYERLTSFLMTKGDTLT